LIDNVAALYVDPRGPYPTLVREWFDAKRDALTYNGPHPVVAHPPCGPWGKLAKLCKRQHEMPLALHAVAIVRTFGGVLEHPRGSKLWEAAGLPAVGAYPDRFGGVTYEVAQVDFGHVARKRTWLYVVGVHPQNMPPLPPKREPTHWVSGSRNAPRGAVPQGIKVCGAEQRRKTPRAFAEFLATIAARSEVYR
jgi:hypothetical protein